MLAPGRSCAGQAPSPRSSPCASSPSWGSSSCCRTCSASECVPSAKRSLPDSHLLTLAACALEPQRRIDDTLSDIRANRPDVVLSIDSKGFAFRVLRALQADPETRGAVACMHYVAPSVWAYRHRRQRKDFSDMGDLLDAMFVLLPFEEQIFSPQDAAMPKWCHFVGHPAVEDFFEHHGAFDKAASGSVDARDSGSGQVLITLGPDALLDLSNYDTEELKARARAVQGLLQTSADHRGARAKHGIPASAFVICALVGRYDDAFRVLLSVAMLLKMACDGDRLDFLAQSAA